MSQIKNQRIKPKNKTKAAASNVETSTSPTCTGRQKHLSLGQQKLNPSRCSVRQRGRAQRPAAGRAVGMEVVPVFVSVLLLVFTLVLVLMLVFVLVLFLLLLVLVVVMVVVMAVVASVLGR